MLFRAREREFASRFHRFLYLNPIYHPDNEQICADLEGVSLGTEEAESRRPPILESRRPTFRLVIPRAEVLLETLRQRLNAGKRPENVEELNWYLDLLVGCTYFRHFENALPLRQAQDGTHRVAAFRAFERDCQHYANVPLNLGPFANNAAHMFAIYLQMRRSLEIISELIQGNSLPVRQLKAAVWNSIFPHQMRLYGLLLFNRMHEITTLILGPSGTGKELVATAIGESRFVPFDAKSERFVEPFAGAFHPVNLSAMPSDLIESEMFGHATGAFTGATKDRVGWFEKCDTGHTVFLDEIGELQESVQVKLLRVLQNREFYRVGETEPRRFRGRVIAATNRDLSREIAAGRFRQDLLFRLCSDVLRTPTLREQLDDLPDDLPFLVRLTAQKCLGEEALPEHVNWLADISVQWILNSPAMGPAYPWPGNFRELEQCVRSVMVRGSYEPTLMNSSPSPAPNVSLAPNSQISALDRFVREVKGGELTFDELLEKYCSFIFSRSENLTDAARTLDKHRATIQTRIKPELVESFRQAVK